MFGLGRKRTNVAWSQATPQQLQERTLALLELSVAAMHAAQQLIVSPGSGASKEFVDRTQSIAEALTGSMPDVEGFTEAAEEFGALAEGLGKWQRTAVNELQRELLTQVRQVVSTSRSAFDDQDDFLVDVQSASSKMEDVQRFGDIEQVRKALRNGLQGLNGLVERQTEKLRAQRQTFDEQLSELEDRLGEVESCGNTDYLTNIANRAALTFYLQTTCRKAQMVDQRYSVAMIDLDDFKTINDTQGHEAGDRALNTVVQHLKEALGSTAFLARFGGDEFMAVYSGPASELKNRLSNLQNRFARKRFQLSDGDTDGTQISMSVGVVDIQRTDTPETLTKRVDEVMYAVKKSGKGRVSRAA